jgi:Flp pilus assembly protein TadD
MRSAFQLCRLLLLITPFVAACDTGPGRQSRAVSEQPLADNYKTATPAAALELARSLQSSGASDEALSVLASANARYPENVEILSTYGRQAAAMGQDALAARLLERALLADPADWRALSAQAVVEGRYGRALEAHRSFLKARAISGANTASLNNLGMSYLLETRAVEAAALFRQALIAPNLDKRHAAQVKRNLAVALAVQGDFEQAKRLAGRSMPRRLHKADAETIAAYMGINAPAIAVTFGWQARVADASSPVSGFAR